MDRQQKEGIEVNEKERKGKVGRVKGVQDEAQMLVISRECDERASEVKLDISDETNERYSTVQ